jgi:disulfide bond formation protein DsbB
MASSAALPPTRPVRARGDRLLLANVLALLVPAALLGGAWGSEIWGGLFPCEMCWWQRYAHLAALPFALLAFGMPNRRRLLVWLAAIAIAVSGVLGGYHAGVELGIFEGITTCTSTASGGSSADLLKAILAAPLVRCDQVQWSLFGVSMAGWNAILSLSAAGVISWLSLKPR